MRIVTEKTINFQRPKDASFFTIAYNTMILRLLMWKRYSAEVIGSILQLIILSSVFFLFATAIGFRNIPNFGTKEIYIFFLSGFLITTFDTVALWSPVNATTRELTNGTLDYLYFTPMKKYPYFLGYLLGSVITSSLVGAIPLFLILIVYANLSMQQVIIILFIIAVLLVSLLAMGILLSLAVILYKQTQALVSLLGLVLEFFTGCFVPLNSLPPYLQSIALLFPHTYAYELLRYYAFNGNWALTLPLAFNWIMILVFAVFYTILALYLHKKVVRHAKVKGLHIL